MSFTRRDWLLGSPGSAPWPVVAAAQEHARHVVANPFAARFEISDESATADVAVIASQILPSDDGPGAKDAGAIFVIYRVPCTLNRDKQDLYRNGAAPKKCPRWFAKYSRPRTTLPRSRASSSSGCSGASRNPIFLTRCGFPSLLDFQGSPAYGGNRDQVGWKYIGFEDRMNWEPTFGHYDAEAT